MKTFVRSFALMITAVVCVVTLMLLKPNLETTKTNVVNTSSETVVATIGHQYFLNGHRENYFEETVKLTKGADAVFYAREYNGFVSDCKKVEFEKVKEDTKYIFSYTKPGYTPIPAKNN